MPKICKEVPLNDYTLNFHKRSDLKEEMIKYWVRRETSNVGLGPLSFKEGVLHSCRFRRTDIFLIQFWDQVNVFVEPNGAGSIQPRKGVEISKEERAQIMEIVDKVMAENADYVNRERNFKVWFDENHEKFDGLTPVEGVRLLESAGF